ncbi:sigma factor-like helix-turn-helix DNA-binding protein [Streptomyces sp. NPDC001941]|uniref:RNA polymerase sigma factor n=1 Tax=Streptomyces sp. NPDC001941 TaxID=3154659 RepID=UPI0033294CBD
MHSMHSIRNTSAHRGVEATHPGTPLELAALRTATQDPYLRYARALLPEVQAHEALYEAFSTLRASFEAALASPDIRRYAWRTLRTAVTTRASRDTDGTLLLPPRPTAARHDQGSRTPSPQLLRLIGTLPEAQLDVFVLRHLCALTPEETGQVLGEPLSATRSAERHALRLLIESAFRTS